MLVVEQEKQRTFICHLLSSFDQSKIQKKSHSNYGVQYIQIFFKTENCWYYPYELMTNDDECNGNIYNNEIPLALYSWIDTFTEYVYCAVQQTFYVKTQPFYRFRISNLLSHSSSGDMWVNTNIDFKTKNFSYHSMYLLTEFDAVSNWRIFR